MSRFSIRKPAVTKEHQIATRIARALTEDFNADLEGVGYYIGSDFAPIIFHRLETMYLASRDEHDRIMGREIQTEGFGKW